MFRVVLALVTACLLCPASDFASKSADADSHAFYSFLLRNLPWSTPEEKVGIFQLAVLFPSTLHCAQPLSGEDEKMVERARAGSQQITTWQQQFHFGHPYLLIAPAEMNKARFCMGALHSRKTDTHCEQYAKMRSIRFLSLPVFNFDHSRVLVFTDQLCSGPCDEGNVRTYRRTPRGWKLESNALLRCKPVNKM